MLQKRLLLDLIEKFLVKPRQFYPMTRTLTCNWQDIPLLPVICGSTATGKSKLAIQLAQALNGEVINADAVQMYAGLPVVTNKVTAEEMQGVPHHLLGILDPLQRLSSEQNNVHYFQQAALQTIWDIHSRGRVPILVGGTHYYLEAVLWDFLVHQDSQTYEDKDWSHLDNQALYECLKNVDPTAASKLHPNDRRKVIRAIQVFHRTQRTVSSYWQEQHGDFTSGKAGERRFAFTSVPIFWLHCQDANVLEKRIRDRVDGMMAAGLLEEVRGLYHTVPPDWNEAQENNEKGIFQSIGYKELRPYLMLSDNGSELQLEKSLQDAVERIKISTRKYARRQVKWVKNRFLTRSSEEAYSIFKIDTSHVGSWDQTVLPTALHIVQAYSQARKDTNFLSERLLPYVPESMIQPRTVTPATYSCEECGGQLFLTEELWQLHLKSRRHHKRLISLRKRKQRMESAALKTDLDSSGKLCKVNFLDGETSDDPQSLSSSSCTS